MTLTWTTAIDWDNDGSFSTSGDDISAYVEGHDIQSGISSPGPLSLVATAGRCKLTVNNTDRRFSPAYAAGPLYGKLLPNRPVRVQASDGTTTWTLFFGFLRSITPDSGLYGARRAVIECIDYLSVIQDGFPALPLQENIVSSDLVKHVVNAALLAPTASGSLSFPGGVANNDAVTINGTIYTFKTTLSGAANEVLIGASRFDSGSNLEAAINNGDGAGTNYASNTTRGVGVTASWGTLSFYPGPNQDTDILLNNTTAPVKSKLAQSFNLATNNTISNLLLLMEKVGTPAGTLTVRIETDSGSYSPSGTLMDANATTTISESLLLTAYSWLVVTFPAALTIAANTTYWIVLSTDRAASGVDYVAWGADASAPTYAGQMWYFSGSWTNANANAIFAVGTHVLAITATLRGAVGNGYGLSVSAPASVTTLTVAASGTNYGIGTNTQDVWEAQSFQGPQGTFTQFTVTLGANSGAPAGTITWKLQADSGGVPSGTDLATGTFTPTPSATNTITVSNGPILSQNTTYWLVLRATTPTPNGVWWNWQVSTTSTYANGQLAFNNGSWVLQPNNDAQFSITTANLTPSGATLSGGVDYPTSPVPSIQAGKQTFDIAADLWSSEKTNGLTAIGQITNSEQGRFWVARDGTITFKHRDYQFTQVTQSAALTLSSEPSQIVGEINGALVFNMVRVKFTPRAVLALGVVAAAKGTVEAIGTSYPNYWNPTRPIVVGTSVVKLPFTDPTTGQPMGAKSIVTPLVPSTDFTANDRSDGLGFDYTNTNPQFVKFSLAITGNDVQIGITNLASGKLYLTKLQVRGVGIVSYNPTTITAEDTASQTAYRRRALSLTLPLPSGQAFASALAYYVLSRYKTPTFRARSIAFQKQAVVNGVNLYSLEIGSVISLTDAQMGMSSVKHLVVGVHYRRVKPGSVGDVTFDVWPLDDTLYGVWDDATYGKWDTARWSI